MTPKGALISGTVFADYLGLEVLQGRWGKGRSVILGEGLTDFLALAISSPYPVLSIPGVATAKSAIGEWVRGRVVHLCFDCDAAGEKAVRDVAPLIRAHGGKPVRISWYGGLKDAGEMIQRYGAHGLSEFLDRVLKLGDSND
jgi:DNA primase